MAASPESMDTRIGRIEGQLSLLVKVVLGGFGVVLGGFAIVIGLLGVLIQNALG